MHGGPLLYSIISPSGLASKPSPSLHCNPVLEPGRKSRTMHIMLIPLPCAPPAGGDRSEFSGKYNIEVLNAIYEQDFLGFSYGFRPGRSPHQALDAISGGIMTRKVNWVLDADIRSFFDTLKHEWLVKFVEHRVVDRRIVRLIQKWLAAGVPEDGKRTQSELGTVQGGS
ncbi:MAG: hypothetical protein HYY28_16020, partial [Betaproteobacteria bacterium]|nr:hypothetical protein [Betaproteobacteria bacterium]